MFCLGVKDVATPLAVLLEDYDVTSALLTQLGTELTAYYAVFKKPKDQISERSIKLDELNTLVDDTMYMITTKLDVVMSIFQFSNPSLYALYLNARNIDSTSTITPPEYEGILAPAEIKLVATIPYLPSRAFIVKNTGTSPLLFCLSNNISIQGVSVAVSAGEESMTLTSLVLNVDNTANNLILQNLNPSEAGSYKIFITE